MTADDGRPDPRLAAALQRWQQHPGPGTRAELLAALSGARVFLALAARTTGTELSSETGLVQERGAVMALLSVVRADGARALPVFSDGHAVQRWRSEARPVPVAGPQACATAETDGAVALLLDPHAAAVVVDAAELAALAAGRVPVPGSTLATRHVAVAFQDLDAPPPAALLGAAGQALRGEPVAAARLLRGPDGLVLGVVPTTPLDAAALTALAARVADRLRGDLPAAGLDLAVVPASGPGHPVPLAGRHR
jgi:hypothetical protein